MHIVKIPKKDRRFRTIYVPNKDEKAFLRSFVPMLNQYVLQVCNTDVVHGFVPGRSPVTNALPHIGYDYTLSFDLEDFFDTVTADKLAGKLPDDLIDAILVDGAARQGLPTSPAVANIAAADMDEAILDFIRNTGEDIVYTRYADDLSFSFNNPQLLSVLKQEIPRIIQRFGFKVNTRKIRSQWSGAGRRVICGVAVDKDGIYAPRRVRRRMKAAFHQNRRRQARGLAEWCQLKLPHSYDIQSMLATYEALRLANLYLPDLELTYNQIRHFVNSKVIKEQQVTNDIIVTNDPVYLLALPDYCVNTDGTANNSFLLHGAELYPDINPYRLTGGSRKRSNYVFLACSGVSFAVKIDPTRQLEIGGVKRPAVLAAAILFQAYEVNGKRSNERYSLIVTKSNDSEIMRELLDNLANLGYIYVTSIPKRIVTVYGKLPMTKPGIRVNYYGTKLKTTAIDNTEKQLTVSR